MRWLALAIVLASLRADARPPRHDDDFFDGSDRFLPSRLKGKKPRPPKPPPPPCKPTASFDKFMRCNFASWKYELVQDLPGAKLIAMTVAVQPRMRKQLAMYVLVNKTNWQQVGLHLELNDTSELLSFKQLGGAYRIDLGFANPQWITVDEFTSHPAIVKRTYTYICDQNAACRSVQSSCDVLVRGKVHATFRGTVVWNGKDLKLRGDDRFTNRYCTKPPAGFLLEPE